MEKNYSSTDHSAEFDRDLSLPHFDEEATLLSARPVVPLNEVTSDKGSKRRPVVFGVTILAAILVGAISATLLMRSGQNSQSAGEINVNQPTPPSTSAAGGSTSAPAETRIPVASAPEEKPQLGEAPGTRSSSATQRQTAAALSHSPVKPVISRTSVEPATPDYETRDESENDERELRRAERRDARREARREHRERRVQKGDDLLRIREIFEGSPRP